jgi:transcriptional regulator of met regulon
MKIISKVVNTENCNKMIAIQPVCVFTKIAKSNTIFHFKIRSSVVILLQNNKTKKKGTKKTHEWNSELICENIVSKNENTNSNDINDK